MHVRGRTRPRVSRRTAQTGVVATDWFISFRIVIKLLYYYFVQPMGMFMYFLVSTLYTSQLKFSVMYYAFKRKPSW